LMACFLSMQQNGQRLMTEIFHFVIYSGQINVDSLGAPDLSSRRRLHCSFPERTR
jgi:hypothetical protein